MIEIGPLCEVYAYDKRLAISIFVHFPTIFRFYKYHHDHRMTLQY